MASTLHSSDGHAQAEVGRATPPGSPNATGAHRVPNVAESQQPSGSPTSTTSSSDSWRSLGSTRATTAPPTGSPKTSSPASPPKLSAPLTHSFADRRPWVLRPWMLSLGSDDFTRFRGHEIEWPALNDFFLYPISDGDARANLGEAESRMTESVPGIKWDLGNPVWEPQGRLVRCPVQEDPELYEPDELPDVVLLSRHSFGANPELASAWASNPDDDEDSDDANRQDWEQVAAIGVLGGMKKNDNTSEWECVIPATRIKHHLLKLAAESPIRSHTFGFTLDGSILTLFLHNPSGLFYSPKIECTEANGHLSTFIARLLSLNDRDLGRVAFPGEPGGRPLPFATAALPPLVPCFACRLGDVPTMSSIEIVETILCSSEVVGLQKTTSRVRDDARGIGSTDDDEDKYAMTVSFVEEAR